jgi:hypothetical protein
MAADEIGELGLVEGLGALDRVAEHLQVRIGKRR